MVCTQHIGSFILKIGGELFEKRNLGSVQKPQYSHPIEEYPNFYPINENVFCIVVRTCDLHVKVKSKHMMNKNETHVD